MKRKLVIFLFVVGLLGGCAANEHEGGGTMETPRQIAAYPGGESGISQTVIYDAYLALQVWDPQAAAEDAVGIAKSTGGYLVQSRTWYREGERFTTLVLNIPAIQFERAYGQLLDLGKLTDEQVRGVLQPEPDPYTPTYFSQITVELEPRGARVRLPEWDLSHWRPARTFASAFQVFLGIFGFLLDVLIWLLVVAGPFGLLYWLVRRFTRRSNEPVVEPLENDQSEP